MTKIVMTQAVMVWIMVPLMLIQAQTILFNMVRVTLTVTPMEVIVPRVKEIVAKKWEGRNQIHIESIRIKIRATRKVKITTNIKIQLQ